MNLVFKIAAGVVIGNLVTMAAGVVVGAKILAPLMPVSEAEETEASTTDEK